MSIAVSGSLTFVVDAVALQNVLISDVSPIGLLIWLNDDDDVLFLFLFIIRQVFLRLRLHYWRLPPTLFTRSFAALTRLATPHCAIIAPVAYPRH